MKIHKQHEDNLDAHGKRLSLRVRAVLIGFSIAAIPLAAWSLTLTDYVNTAQVSASSSQFETNTADNVDDVQITPNAELVVVAVIDNLHGGNATVSDFSVASDAGSLVFDSGSTLGSFTIYTASTLHVAPGTYSLTEIDVAGYNEGSWSCTVGTVNDTTYNTGSVTLAFGEQTVCSITNSDISPQLILTASMVNDHGGNATADDFDLSVAGATVLSGVSTSVQANSSITIAEIDLPGYVEGVWNCVDASGLATGLPTSGDASGTSVVLAEGSVVTCNITNDDIAPLLTLAVNLINDNGGTATIDDFDVSVDSTEVSVSTALAMSANTSITISELDLPAYAEGTWSCADTAGLTIGLPVAGDATGTSLTLMSGANVVCSIVNNDSGIDLSIVSAVDDQSPNIGQTVTITLTVENSGPDTATDVVVTDVVPAGLTYVAASMTGGDTTNELDPAGTGLVWGVNTLITNTPVDLTFDAVVNPP